MGNAQARKRVKAGDFQYIARNTAFLTNDVSKNNNTHTVNPFSGKNITFVKWVKK